MFNNPYTYIGYTPNQQLGIGALRGGDPVRNVIPQMQMGLNNFQGVRGLGTGIARGVAGVGPGVARGGAGIFSRLGGALNSLKSFNWGGIINNASKTIGVINQTIPLVKQAGPMIKNMKSVMRLASVFKDETDPVSIDNSNKTKDVSNEKKDITSSKSNTHHSEEDTNSQNNIDFSDINYPVFFVN